MNFLAVINGVCYELLDEFCYDGSKLIHLAWVVAKSERIDPVLRRSR